MGNKTVFILACAVCTFAQSQNSPAEEFAAKAAKLLSESNKVGPCHTPVSPQECIAWHQDSSTIKLDTIPEWKLEKWRHCCNHYRDSTNTTKK